MSHDTFIYRETSPITGEKRDLFHSYENESSPIPVEYYKLLIQWLSFLPDNTPLLDVGGGGGQIANFFLKKTHRTFQVDISPESLKLAKKTIPFVSQSDAIELPFSGNYFSGAHIKDVICHINDKAAFFKEQKRILKPGGRLLIVTQHIPQNFCSQLVLTPNNNKRRIILTFKSFSQYQEHVENVLKRRVTHWQKEEIIDISPPYFETRNRHLLELANASGFQYDYKSAQLFSKNNYVSRNKNEVLLWHPQDDQNDWLKGKNRILLPLVLD